MPRAAQWLAKAALLAAVAATITGCAPTEQTVGGKERPAEQLQGIVSLSPSVTEALVAAGVPIQGITGRTANCNHPTFIQGKVVVTGTKPNFELIAELKPSYVIYDTTLYSQADIAKLEELGLRTISFEPTSLQKYSDFIVQVAKLSATETTASEYLDKIYAAIDVLRGVVPPDTSVAVLTGDATQGYLAAGTNSFLADLFTQGGLTVKGPAADRFQPASIEQLVADNPSVIIATKETAEAVLADPKLQALSAVRDRKVLGVNPDILLRAGGRVDVLLDGVSTGIARIKELKGN